MNLGNYTSFPGDELLPKIHPKICLVFGTVYVRLSPVRRGGVWASSRMFVKLEVKSVEVCRSMSPTGLATFNFLFKNLKRSSAIISVSKDVEKILEGKITCRLHRRTPKEPFRSGENLTSCQRQGADPCRQTSDFTFFFGDSL